MDAIKRLEDVYELKPFDFTGGQFGIHTALGSFLTAMDAYNFGRGAYVSEDMENTQQWMQESLRLLDMEADNPKEKPSRFSILDHLAWSSYQVTIAFFVSYYSLLPVIYIKDNRRFSGKALSCQPG